MKMIEQFTCLKSLKNLTTFKIGGVARFYSICNSIGEIQQCISWCSQKKLPWIIIGNGSNILVDDEGIPGLVLRLGEKFKSIVFLENEIEVGAGILLPTMSSRLMVKGWGGFEFMCGIPGTVGGAVRMNAGTKQNEIKDYFISATILSADGKLRTVYKDDMRFSNRTSMFAKSKDIILSVKFKLAYPEKPAHIKERIKKNIAWRRERQPRNKRNCGSVFKRPIGCEPAGWYIDQSGLKGLRVGDAMISHEHANWIVNIGNAKAEHVKELICMTQEKVLHNFGIALEREVVFVPEDIKGD
jgi:UDP-N-acetylmuramate dehydrogenase